MSKRLKFGLTWMPAPISPMVVAASRMVTLCPALERQYAAASPPKPQPTITMFRERLARLPWYNSAGSSGRETRQSGSELRTTHIVDGNMGADSGSLERNIVHRRLGTYSRSLHGGVRRDPSAKYRELLLEI